MGGISVLFLMGILSSLFLVFIFIFIAIFFTYVVGYLFEGLTASSFLKVQGQSSIKGWIPFYNKYLIGQYAGVSTLGIVSAICAAPILILGYVLFFTGHMNHILLGLFLLFLLVGFITDHIIAYQYLSKRSRYVNLLVAISVLTVGFLRPVILFTMKDKQTIE